MGYIKTLFNLKGIFQAFGPPIFFPRVFVHFWSKFAGTDYFSCISGPNSQKQIIFRTFLIEIHRKRLFFVHIWSKFEEANYFRTFLVQIRRNKLFYVNVWSKFAETENFSYIS